MESIFKMAIWHLSVRPSECCIFAIFKPTIIKFWILMEDYVRIINIWFFDSWSISSEIELGLGPSQINICFIIFHTFWGFFRSLLSFELIQWYIFVVQIQNGEQKQDGQAQAWIFYSSVNFNENQLKLGIWKERHI
jgi:hypothetical protein